MRISAESHIVGKVPAWVIRVFIDDNLIGIPQPVRTESEIGRSNRPEPPVKPEPARSTSSEYPGVFGSKAAVEVAMLKGLVKMICRVVGAGIMTNPDLPFVHMRHIGVAGLIAVVTARRGRCRSFTSG